MLDANAVTAATFSIQFPGDHHLLARQTFVGLSLTICQQKANALLLITRK